jgi:hypothetical protein
MEAVVAAAEAKLSFTNAGRVGVLRDLTEKPVPFWK